MPESKLTEFLAKQYGVRAINLDDFDIKPEIVALVPRDVALRHLVVPVNLAGPSLIVAMCDPSNISAVDDLRFLTGNEIEPVVASEPGIREAIRRCYDRPTWAELIAALHLVVFAEGIDRTIEAVMQGRSWPTLAARPFSFLGQWWLHRQGEAKPLGQWMLRRPL